MNKKVVRSVASVAIVAITAGLFVRYLQAHPSYVTQLEHTNPWWVTGILIADFGGITALAALFYVLIKITGKNIDSRENWLLTIYSSIANFFGPLQSGPGVRAAYLKTRHQVSLRAYFLVSLLAYAAFAIISAFMLVVGTQSWWLAVLACGAAGAVSYGVMRFAIRQRHDIGLLQLTPKYLGLVFALTALQISFIGARYYLALRAGGVHVSLGQLVSYTGAANFALFVSITPDGVGIREAFLLFAQKIHGVPTQAIISANLIDRATFVLFLALLFVIAFLLHASDKFRSRTSSDNDDAADPV